MKVGVPRETAPGERRVALVPDAITRLPAGFEVLVETGAGAAASFPDAAYGEAGATVVPDAATVYRDAAIVVTVQTPSPEEVAALH